MGTAERGCIACTSEWLSIMYHFIYLQIGMGIEHLVGQSMRSRFDESMSDELIDQGKSCNFLAILNCILIEKNQ
jgi:hypothetical protein